MFCLREEVLAILHPLVKVLVLYPARTMIKFLLVSERAGSFPRSVKDKKKKNQLLKYAPQLAKNVAWLVKCMKFQLLNSTALINKAHCTVGNVSRISTTVLVSYQINQACSWISKLCNWSSKICTFDWVRRIGKVSNILNWHTIGLSVVSICLEKSRGKICNFY